MDIKTAAPEKYAQWLLSQGVKPDALRERIAHDMMRALSKQMEGSASPTVMANSRRNWTIRLRQTLSNAPTNDR